MDKDAGIIILGHPRSGTTLLRRLLNGHSAIASPPETHIFNSVARSLGVDLTADGVDMGLLAGLNYIGYDDEDVLARLRKFSFGFLQDYAKRQGKRRWAEKTAFSIFHLNAIETLCGQHVRYVGIIRHPFDVACSCIDFCEAAGVYPDKMHDYIAAYPQPVEAFVRSWMDTTSDLIELGQNRPDQCVVVRYEDLVTNPADTLSDILGFLGEDMEDSLIETALNVEEAPGFSDHKGLGETGVHQESVGRWASIPSPQIARLGALVNPMLTQCGYDPIAGAAAPSIKAARERYAKSLAIHAARRERSS